MALLFYTKRGTNKAAHVSPSPHGCGCQEHNTSFLPFPQTKPWSVCMESLSYNNDPRKHIFLSAFLVLESLSTTEPMGPIPDFFFPCKGAKSLPGAAPQPRWEQLSWGALGM